MTGIDAEGRSICHQSSETEQEAALVRGSVVDTDPLFKGWTPQERAAFDELVHQRLLEYRGKQGVAMRFRQTVQIS